MMLKLTPEERKNAKKLRLFITYNDRYYISHCLDIYLARKGEKSYLLLARHVTEAPEEERDVLNFIKNKTTFLDTTEPIFIKWDKVCNKMVCQELLGKDAGIANLFFQDLAPVATHKLRYLAYYNVCRHQIAYRDGDAWRPIEHAYNKVTLESELSASRTSVLFDNYDDLMHWGASRATMKVPNKKIVEWSKYETILDRPLYTTRWFRIGSQERGTFEPGAIRPIQNGWEIAWAIRSGLCFSDEEKELLAEYRQEATM